MKNKVHYFLIPIYVLTVIFVLFINGVFGGAVSSASNLMINVGFLVVMGILLIISFVSFVKVDHCIEELLYTAKQFQKESQMKEGELCLEYLKRQDVFVNNELKDAFTKYQLSMKKYQTKRGFKNICDIEEYINEDLIDRISKNFYNSNMPGTLTGLGILGTFLGLTLGLASFSGDNIVSISDSMGPLLEGIKVAFHTSVYGIFLSLVFSFIYRAVMANAYLAVEKFQKAFRQYVVPVRVEEDEDTSAMLIYQANTAALLKEMVDLLKAESAEQTKSMDRIVERFIGRMAETMGVEFYKLGNSLKNAAETQVILTRGNKELMKTVEMLLLANHDLQERMTEVLNAQEKLSEELKEQKKDLKISCDAISDEISSNLYAFDKMRNLYEK